MKILWTLTWSIVVVSLLSGCNQCSTQDSSDNTQTNVSANAKDLPDYPSTPIAEENLKWLTNDKDTPVGSPNAVKGGTFKSFMTTYPLTFRTVGPDSNHGLRSLFSDNDMGLIYSHPNTQNIIPGIAESWAFSTNKKTMYFKINPNARWSDGVPIRANDFMFILEFFRSKHILAPFSNNYYSEMIDKIVKHDDLTISVSSTKPRPDIHEYLALAPVPRHFYGKIDKDFVKKYNWAIVPNSGPYILEKFSKGKSLVFKRKKDWWAKDLRYNKGRFNVDRISIKTIRDQNTAFTYFLKGQLDAFDLTEPDYWHKNKDAKVFNNGYIKKHTFYNDIPRPSYGFWLNQKNPLLSDINIRRGIAHSIDADKVIKQVLRGESQRLDQHFTGYGKYTNPSIRPIPFDPKKAAASFAKAGFTKRGGDGILRKGNQKLSIEVRYGKKMQGDRLAIIKESAKEAGIELVIKYMDGSAFFKSVLEKKHQIAFMGWSVGSKPRYWQFYHSDNANKPQTNNITNMSIPALDKKIEVYRASVNTEERIVLTKEIQQMLSEKIAQIPSWAAFYFRDGYWNWWKLPKTPGSKESGSSFDTTGYTAGGLFWYDAAEHEKTKKAMKSGTAFDNTVATYDQYKTN